MDFEEDRWPEDTGINWNDPWEALRFLSGRFRYAGVSEVVAAAYADDIDKLLKKFNQQET